MYGDTYIYILVGIYIYIYHGLYIHETSLSIIKYTYAEFIFIFQKARKIVTFLLYDSKINIKKNERIQEYTNTMCKYR